MTADDFRPAVVQQGDESVQMLLPRSQSIRDVIGCNNRIILFTIHSALRTSLIVACRGSANAYQSHGRVRLHDTVGRELNRWLTLSASIKIARRCEWNGNRGGRPWGQGASRLLPIGNTHTTAFHGASTNGCGDKRKSTDAIVLVANDVTRYHDYASGSHRGASRTNYPPKWHLAIGMLCRF